LFNRVEVLAVGRSQGFVSLIALTATSAFRAGVSAACGYYTGRCAKATRPQPPNIEGNRSNEMVRSKLLAGLIGEEIEGSSSRQIHEDEAAAHGFELTYRLIDFTKPRRGADFLEPMLLAAESLGFSGLNVTYPFKAAVPKLMNTLSADARNIGTVNTVVLREGRRHGDNTDWSAFADNFRVQLPGAKLDRVALIGSGGAGHAVAYAVLKMNLMELRLFDAEKERAHDLAGRLRKNFPDRSILVSTDAASALQGADGFIQSTPVGMVSHPGMPVDAELLQPSMWVADLVYFPLETALLKEAKRRGCQVVGGGGMAVRQAARSFQEFFQVEPNVDRMLERFFQNHRKADAH
jgi:shikimate dehydrogenase